ncbi:hypothetical protein LCD36_05450 [Saccharopolyspora sp. 6T]|uniref:hypothetical protein n=1 Tax=Saccharopolyspora sp. 6T TaxID=2877238 RepID=UPI001CD51F60|nr:hypothetical protein [Saccharopolyspora sp. 6T]MCA1185894.1 hypothetical protein [Saccharopolyspora sp. 6T]
MFTKLLSTDLAFQAVLIILLSIAYAFMYIFTLGQGVRIFVGAVYVRDFRSNARVRHLVFRRTLASLSFLIATFPVGLFSFSVAVGIHEDHQILDIPIMLASLPVVYLVLYPILGARIYSNLRKTTSDPEKWTPLLGENYASTLREIRVAHASNITSAYWVLFVGFAPAMWALGKVLTFHPPTPFSDVLAGGSVALIGLALGLFAMSAFSILDRVLPHRRVINRCLVLLKHLEKDSPGSPTRKAVQAAQKHVAPPQSFSASRWRNPMHKAGFDLARALEKTALGFRGKFTQDDYVQIYTECTKLANSLRSEAMEGGSPESRERYADLVRCALSFVASDNPTRLLPYVRTIASEQQGKTPPSGRFLLFLESINEHAQHAWGTVKVFGALVAITFMVIYGKWDAVGKFFLQ